MQAIVRKTAVSEDKAKAVYSIQASYKMSMNAIMADNNLSDKEKRERVDELIVIKNTKLSKVLNEAELQKFLPLSEQQGQRSKITQQDFGKKVQEQSLAENDIKSEIFELQKNYEQEVKKIKLDVSLTEEARNKKISEMSSNLYQKMDEILSKQQNSSSQKTKKK